MEMKKKPAETAVNAMLTAVDSIDLLDVVDFVMFAVSVGLTKPSVTGRDLEQVS